MTKKDLTPIEQKEVIFYEDELTAIRADDGQVYVSVRHMCDALGIQRPQRQTDRIKRDEVLNDGLQRVPIMGTRGRQLTYVLRVDLVPLWLTGLEPSRVGDKVQDKIIRYKREAAKVLWEAFQEGRLTTDPSFEELLKSDSPAVQAYKTFQALTKLARNQILIEAKLEDHEQRLERIEATLGDTGKNVTPAQASQLSQAVKAIAMEIAKTTKRNEYGAVYGEFYRREGITSYKLLPAHRFDTVMKWFNEWYKQVTDKDLPF
jgi:hypothetical protein